MKTICECGAEIEPDRTFKIQPVKDVFMMECENCKKKYHVQITVQNW
jgi:hypothetical protein